MCFSCGFRSHTNRGEDVVSQPRHPIGSPVYQEKANARILNGPTVVNGKLVEKQRDENGEVVSHGFIPVASRKNFTDAQLEDFRAFFAQKKAEAPLNARTVTVLAASQSAADAITSTTAFVQQQLNVVAVPAPTQIEKQSPVVTPNDTNTLQVYEVYGFRWPSAEAAAAAASGTVRVVIQEFEV